MRNVKPLWSKFGTCLAPASGPRHVDDTFGFSLFGTLGHGKPDPQCLKPARDFAPIAYPKPDGRSPSTASHRCSSPTRTTRRTTPHLVVHAWRYRSHPSTTSMPGLRRAIARPASMNGSAKARSGSTSSTRRIACIENLRHQDPNNNITGSRPEGGGGPNYLICKPFRHDTAPSCPQPMPVGASSLRPCTKRPLLKRGQRVRRVRRAPPKEITDCDCFDSVPARGRHSCCRQRSFPARRGCRAIALAAGIGAGVAVRKLSRRAPCQLTARRGCRVRLLPRRFAADPRKANCLTAPLSRFWPKATSRKRCGSPTGYCRSTATTASPGLFSACATSSRSNIRRRGKILRNPCAGR